MCETDCYIVKLYKEQSKKLDKAFFTIGYLQSVLSERMTSEEINKLMDQINEKAFKIYGI